MKILASLLASLILLTASVIETLGAVILAAVAVYLFVVLF